MDPKEEGALLVDRPGEGSLAEAEELRSILELGRERGYVTFDELGTSAHCQPVNPGSGEKRYSGAWTDSASFFGAMRQ